MNRITALLAATMLAGAGAMATAAAAATTTATATGSYTMADFYKVPKIDAHLHLHSTSDVFIRQARKDRFKALAINVDYADFPPVAEQLRVAKALRRAHPREVAFVTTFSTEGFGQPGWGDAVTGDLDQAFADGAVGVKVWKNIGMSLKGPDGKLVMVDDARFDGVFRHIAQRGMTVLGHQGEPKNCWLPLEQMTVNSDREYFKNHPHYHMYLQPAMPSYEQQMAARDALLARHPRLRFVGVHMASLEWSVDELARFLDSHPGANVDIAARIGQVQYQSGLDRDEVRRFFIQYQDRLMYGTDLAQSGAQSAGAFADEIHRVWLAHWRYFNTTQSQKVPELDAPVKGLALPRQVVDKLFRLNAERQYPQGWRAPAARAAVGRGN